MLQEQTDFYEAHFPFCFSNLVNRTNDLLLLEYGCAADGRPRLGTGWAGSRGRQLGTPCTPDYMGRALGSGATGLSQSHGFGRGTSSRGLSSLVCSNHTKCHLQLQDGERAGCADEREAFESAACEQQRTKQMALTVKSKDLYSLLPQKMLMNVGISRNWDSQTLPFHGAPVSAVS